MFLDSFRRNLSTSEHGYHRKCYEKYMHEKLLQKLDFAATEPEAEMSTASLDGKNETVRV